MIFQNSSTTKAKTAQNVILRACLPVGTARSRNTFFRILKISAIFLTIIILFFGTARLTSADTLDDLNPLNWFNNVEKVVDTVMTASIKAAAIPVMGIATNFVLYFFGLVSATI